MKKITNILVVGCGGREHAMIKSLQKNGKVNVYCYAPFKQKLNGQQSVPYRLFRKFSTEECKQLCIENKITFAIVGSEHYLNTNIVSELETIHVHCICPNKQMAQIETSKSFARNLIGQSLLHGFNPDYLIVNKQTSFFSVIDFLNKWKDKVVVKADGLHGGKGVKVFGDHLFNRTEIIEYIYDIVHNNENVVIEEKLEGKEFSFISITDGCTTVDCPAIKDYKRLLNSDRGPNTGSMGCISDENGLNFLTTNDVSIVSKINHDVVQLLNTDEEYYKGFLYGSYIKTKEGHIKIIEFNARLGDPEAIIIMEQLDTDFLEICQRIGKRELHTLSVQFKNRPSLCTYLVPKGYPENP